MIRVRGRKAMGSGGEEMGLGQDSRAGAHAPREDLSLGAQDIASSVSAIRRDHKRAGPKERHAPVDARVYRDYYQLRLHAPTGPHDGRNLYGERIFQSGRA